MKAAYSALVTGAASRKNAGTSTVCAGRSLSSAHGSVSVPIVNGPPGISTSAGTATRAGGGGGGGPGRGRAPARGPRRPGGGGPAGRVFRERAGAGPPRVEDARHGVAD